MRQAPGQQFEWLDRIFVLHALKVGLAGVLALFVAQALRLQYPEWSVFTVMTLNMAHYYPGSVALKALFHSLGTLVGASLGVWLVSDYLSAPVLFLSVTFVVMFFASCKVGHLSSKMAPYAYFMTGVTLIIVESTGLTQPGKEWFVALSRIEETFVGVGAVLIVTPLFWVRRPRLEFQRLANASVDQLKRLTSSALYNITEGTRSSSELVQEQTAVLRKLLSLDSLLIAERRESLYFGANTAIHFKTRNSLRNLFQAVLDLSQSPVSGNAPNQPFRTHWDAVQDLFERRFCEVDHAPAEDRSMLASAFQAIDEEINRRLRSGDIRELSVDQLAANLRCWNAFRRIQNELLILEDLEDQLQSSTQATVTQSHPPSVQQKVDRRLVTIGFKGGLVAVVSLFLLVWLHLPGAPIMPVAAWLALIFTSYEIPLGRPGHVRSFQKLLQMALYGLLIVFVLLVLTPLMSNYWVMNLILFCILFAHGYFASRTSGLAFWMLGALFLVSVLVGLDAQKAVSFASIMNSYLAVMTGLTIGVTIARVLWPRLPQNELKEAAARFCDAAKLALGDNSEVATSKINSILLTLPLDIARATAALGVNRFLRQEQTKWNRLVPILISLSAQLPRLALIRANVVGIAPRVPGPIIRIVVVDNQHVQRGDLLFEIDPADYRAAVERERAQVLAATAALTQKKQDLDRQTELLRKKVNALEEYEDAQDNYDNAQANLAAAKANLTTAELKLSYTEIYSSVNGEVTNLDISEGSYASAGQQVMALVDSDSYWVAGYFKETQLRNISTGDRATISLLGDEDQPFRGTVRSVGWGIYVTDGSSGENSLLPSVEGTALLPAVSPTVDWVRLPQRFPVRIQVDSSATGRLRIGQTASVAISHGARRENTRVIQ